jgi:predicted amidohydrolase
MLKVYLIQLDSAKGDKNENIARAKRIILEKKPTEGSLVLLPEMFATGYIPANLSEAAEDFSTCKSGETAHMLSEVATATGCTIMGAGISRAREANSCNQFLNHVSIYNPRSAQEFCGYDKMNLFFPEKDSFRPGVEVNLFKLQDWTVASFICYDLRFPEIFRHATQKGAKLITIQAAWPAKRRAHWETLLKARAIENQVYIAAVNAVSESPDTQVPLAGTSLIISPNGDILAEGPAQSESVISAELDLEAERHYRKSFPVLDGIVPPEFL